MEKDLGCEGLVIVRFVLSNWVVRRPLAFILPQNETPSVWLHL